MASRGWRDVASSFPFSPGLPSWTCYHVFTLLNNLLCLNTQRQRTEWDATATRHCDNTIACRFLSSPIKGTHIYAVHAVTMGGRETNAIVRIGSHSIAGKRVLFYALFLWAPTEWTHKHTRGKINGMFTRCYHGNRALKIAFSIRKNLINASAI